MGLLANHHWHLRGWYLQKVDYEDFIEVLVLLLCVRYAYLSNLLKFQTL